MSLQQHAIEIFQAGVEAVAPVKLLDEAIQLSGSILQMPGAKIQVPAAGVSFIAMGKAAPAMAAAMCSKLRPVLRAGIAAAPHGAQWPALPEHIIQLHGGHPLPDAFSVRAGRRILDFARSRKADEIVLVAISGGTSALVAVPQAGISLKEKRQATEILIQCGATISEINAVRARLSDIKGGGLLKALAPARCYSLLLSDVIGDAPERIGSGPTVPNPDSSERALEVCQKYDLQEKLPVSVWRHLQLAGPHAVPVLKDPPQIIGSNAIALDGAAREAKHLGYRVKRWPQPVQGEARELAAQYAHALRRILADRSQSGKAICLLAGGEPTVTVRGTGKGGRSQELALAFLPELAKTKRALFLAAGTDGIDGPTDAAGAFASQEIHAAACNKQLSISDFLQRNDAYTFFSKAGGLFKPGATGTNVMDLHILLVADSTTRRASS